MHCDLIQTCNLSKYWKICTTSTKRLDRTLKIDANQIASIGFKGSLCDKTEETFACSYKKSDCHFGLSSDYASESTNFVRSLNKLIQNTHEKNEEFLVGFFIIWRISTYEDDRKTSKYGIIPKILTSNLIQHVSNLHQNFEQVISTKTWKKKFNQKNSN